MEKCAKSLNTEIQEKKARGFFCIVYNLCLVTGNAELGRVYETDPTAPDGVIWALGSDETFVQTPILRVGCLA